MWVTAMARLIVAIVLLAIIAGPVFAQQKPAENPLAAEDRERKKEAEKVDKQYNAMRKHFDQAATPTNVDPWQNMRGANDPKAKK